MRSLAVSVFVSLFACASFAQLTPGAVVKSGEPFPIVADFNGDGLDDLIQEHTVILSDDAGFGERQTLAVPSAERVVAALDVNGDRMLDLVTQTVAMAIPPSIDPTGGGGSSPHYRLYIATASGKFAKAIEVSTGPRPYVSDVDADGKDDLVLASDVREGVRNVATDITVLRSRGDGTFERLPAVRIAPDAQIEPEYRVLTGDVDHDGHPDLVIRCTHDLVVMHGTGGGNFTVDSRYMPMNTEFGSWTSRLADVDGDSNLDVVIAGLRSLRVFFGDGRGNFPRTTRAAIAKLHDAANLPAGVPFGDLDKFNQPRDLAIGHFTRSDRAQIAAGTMEGDLVVFSWEQGSLQEVSRTPTEFWSLDIRSGHFRNASTSDVYVMGTLIWGDVWPRPRVFNGVVTANAVEPSRVGGRTRASRVATPELSLESVVSGDCVDAAPARWKFVRDGAFAVSRDASGTVEAIIDGAQMYIRTKASYSQEPIEAVLTAAPDGTWSGTANALTSCGWKVVSITAKSR